MIPCCAVICGSAGRAGQTCASRRTPRIRWCVCMPACASSRAKVVQGRTATAFCQAAAVSRVHPGKPFCFPAFQAATVYRAIFRNALLLSCFHRPHRLCSAACCQVDALTPVDPVSNTSVTLLTAPVVPANAAALPVDQLPFAQVPSVIPSVCLPLHLLCSGDASVWEAWEATACCRGSMLLSTSGSFRRRCICCQAIQTDCQQCQ